MNLHTPMFKRQNPPFKGPKPPTPFPFGLPYIASAFPHGMESMMHLARLSRVLGARKVAWAWADLSKPDQQLVMPETLCKQAGISCGEFLAAVTETAFELDVDVEPVFTAIIHMPDALSAALRAAWTTGEHVVEAHAALEHIGREVQRR